MLSDYRSNYSFPTDQPAEPNMNGNFNLQQQAAQQFQNQQNQQYAPYYFAQGQQSQPAVQAQPNQATQPQQSTQGTPQAAQTSIQPSGGQAESDPTYAYSRYHTTAAAYQAPPNYAMYQQAIPNQLSHPQPQQYSSGTSGQAAYAGAGVVAAAPSGATSNSNSTPVQDTLNATSSSMVGQYQPAGIRPRVTTTMWEDEKTLCYQVDANNVSVVRRADNNMINGTKLLNVAQMTRGRRDGILKSEKIRHVVKIGSMHLKGVWIPFERALAMAQREGIVDLLYPLFVRDIKRVIQTGVTPSSSGAASAAAQAAAQAAAVSQASAKSASTPTASNVTPTTGQPNLGLYQQYNQQYGSGQQYSQVNGAATASSGPGASGQHSPSQTEQQRQLQYQQVSQQQPQQQQVQQNSQSQTQQTQQAQSGQVYGYQQPYYAGAAAQAGTAPNQYYQSYNSTPNYSATYGSQPMYSYGYNQQMPPQMPPQGTPQIAGGTAGSSIPSQVGSSDTQGTSMKEEKR